MPVRCGVKISLAALLEAIFQSYKRSLCGLLQVLLCGLVQQRLLCVPEQSWTYIHVVLQCI